eukprot:scaffold9426_cov67-Phaeocystis_antarctica.AAC.2
MTEPAEHHEPAWHGSHSRALFRPVLLDQVPGGHGVGRACTAPTPICMLGTHSDQSRCRMCLGDIQSELRSPPRNSAQHRRLSKHPLMTLRLHRRSRRAICAVQAHDGLNGSLWAIVASRAVAGACSRRLIFHVVAVAIPERTGLPVRAGSHANAGACVGDLGSLTAEPEGQCASTQPSGAIERGVF